MEKKYYVYIHKDKETGLVVYCGKGSNFRYRGQNSRREEHAVMMKEGRLEYIILNYFEDEKAAYDFEEEITAVYKKINQCELNISIGRKPCSETKMKLSKILKGQKRGIEARNNIKRNHTRSKSKEVLLYNKEGILLKKFRSAREAGIYATENGVCSFGWVSRSLKTGEQTKGTYDFPIKGYRFIYSSDKMN